MKRPIVGGYNTMDLISGLMAQQKTQSADEIIPMLCDRLAHARLASDKRAAILTLKGFSRQYRESVIANGLRAVIATMKEYTIDTDIIKACLETILILFIRGEGDDDLTRSWISQQSRSQNGKYPSPLLLKEEGYSMDQFSLWIADEITQSEENIALIVSLLENTDFYVRLYTLQLLEALISTRSVKTKELLLNSPLGIPSLVQVLDDVHDPVRNEAVLLLMAVANDNFSIQKLIAFENTFDKLFEIIHEEGDIRGSIVVQDCLTLLANLLKYNVSNQKLFLETNCLPKLSYLIAEPLGEEHIVWNDQRLQNVEITLDIVKLLVTNGNESTKANQNLLHDADIFLNVLRLSFSLNTPNSLRPHALLTVADLISQNNDIQHSFSHIDVPYIDPTQPKQLQVYKNSVSVITSLLNWCLLLNSVHVFDIRVSAAYLLRAYFDGNDEGMSSFLDDQIAYFHGEVDVGEEPDTIVENDTESRDDQETQFNGSTDPSAENATSEPSTPTVDPRDVPIANIFHALLEYDPDIKLNPYKTWFSACTLIYLMKDNEEVKTTVRQLTSGDAESGEEVLSAIQAMFGNLLANVHAQDPRIAISYLMILIVMLYEDSAAVDDFLSDISNLKSLLQFLSQPDAESPIVQGLATVLVGIAYEFSSKNSPIPRVDLHSLIIKIVGKDNYAFKILQLKEAPLFYTFTEEDIFHPSKDETGLPSVFLESTVVWLIKEHFYRIKNTLNRDPNIESNGRLSYEKYELLQDEHHELQSTYQNVLQESKKVKHDSEQQLKKLSTDLGDVSHDLDVRTEELTVLKSRYSDLESKFTHTSKDLAELQKQHGELTKGFEEKSKDVDSFAEQVLQKDNRISKLDSELEMLKSQKKKAEDGINKMSRELFQLSKEKEDLEKKVKQLEKESQKSIKQQEKLDQSLKQKNEELNSYKSKLDAASKSIETLNASKAALEKALLDEKSTNGNNKALISQMTEKLRSIATTCNELTSSKAMLEEQFEQSKQNFSKQLEEYRAKQLELETSQSDLVAFTEELEKEKNELSKSVSSLTSQKDSEIAKLQDEIKKEKELIHDVKSQLENSNAQCKEHEDLISSLRSSIDSMKEESHELSKKHSSELEMINSKHDDKIKFLQKTIEEKSSEKDEVISSFQNQLDELGNEKTAIEQELTKCKSEVSDKAKSLKSQSLELEKLKSEIQGLVDEVSELNKAKELADNDLKVSSKESEERLAEFQKTIDDLLKTKIDLETELDDIAAEFEAKEADFKKQILQLTETVSSTESEKKSLSSTMEMISQTVELKNKEAESLSHLLKTKTKDLETLENELSTVKAEKDALEKSIETSKKTITEFKSSKAILTKDVEALSEKLRNSSQELKAAKSKLEDEKAKASSKVQSLTKEIGELKETMKEASSGFEKERALLTENSSSTVKEYSEKITLLEEKLKTAQSSHESKLHDLESENSNLSETISELNMEITKLKDDSADKESKITQLKETIEENTSKVESLESQLSTATQTESLLRDLESKAKKLESDLSKSQSLVQTKDEELKLAKSSLEKIEKQKQALESTNKSLVTESEDAESLLSELKASHKKALKKLEDSLSSLQKSRDDLQKKLENEKSTTKEFKALSESKTKELTQEVVDLKSSQKSMEEKLKTLIDSSTKKESDYLQSIEDLTKQNETLNLKITELLGASVKSEDLQAKEEQITALQETTADLKQQIAALSKLKEENIVLETKLSSIGKNSVPKSEFDEMILVMDDLDEKKNKYKMLAKKLGADVSSDEESEDDDDEDED